MKETVESWDGLFKTTVGLYIPYLLSNSGCDHSKNAEGFLVLYYFPARGEEYSGSAG